jgi:hypothetical protein
MEDRIWVAIHPQGSETRVLATEGTGSTLLKARLSTRPWHERALPSLLEALALWQSRRVHAVLVVDDGAAGTFATSLCPDLAAEHARTPLYTLDVVEGRRRPPRRRESIVGVGDFRDLRQLMLFEVAR